MVMADPSHHGYGKKMRFKHVFLSIERAVFSGLEIHKLPLIAQLHYQDTGSCKEMFIMIHIILFKHNDKRNI